MGSKESPALQEIRVRVKPRTIADAKLLATQHQEDLPDIWRAAIERGLPLVALFAGPDPQTQKYGTYTEEELARILQPVAALLYGFYAQRDARVPLLPPPGKEHNAPPMMPPGGPRQPESFGNAFPGDDASSALLGLGIDLG